MYIEFVCPPHSNEVIASAEASAVPRQSEIVRIKGKKYEVKDIEWVVMKCNTCDETLCPIINLYELK